MIQILLLVCLAALKVFKKTTPNGKVTVYLGKREFVDHLDHIDPIDGVIVVESDYLKGRKVFGQVTATYRFGREEDEVMGVKFSKELVIANSQLVPTKDSEEELTPIQARLVKKFGANATPFTFKFPPNAPSSVMIQTVNNDDSKPLGVEYSVKTYVGEHIDDKSHKRSTVVLAIKKIQYAPPTRGNRLPSSLASKGFTFSQGKVNLEVTLDREIYYHGEKVSATVIVSNSSRKSVKNMKVMIVQHVEVTMVNSQFSRIVGDMETKEGCPITPGASLTKTFYLIPQASSNKDRHGIALDGHLKDDDVNLASSTLVPEGQAPHEAMGIIISYSMRVKLHCGTLGGELQTDVPFKLMHPAPGTIQTTGGNQNTKPTVQSAMTDDDDNIVFEEFARLRLTEQ
ncbi:arrestin homolog [Hetaerina americana]|uniref:arrestin homolog n=1 Tax=Hetaerina americana TaxID=62018 RepID=UPI003A7F1BD0